MPALEEVDRHEDGEKVHVGRVELEVHVVRAHMVASRHDSDHEEGEAHRVEEGEGCAGSSLAVGHLPVGFGKLAPQLENSWPAAFAGWFLAHLLQLPPQGHVLLHEGDQEEEKAKEHVAEIAQDVVPHLPA